MKTFCKISLLLLVTTAASCSQSLRLGSSPIEDVVGALSNEEKSKLLVGTGMAGREENTDEAIVGEIRSIVPGAGAVTYPVDRLGITPIVFGDGPAGLRISPTRDGDTATYYCTHFPIGTTLACTWNKSLVEEVGRCIGNEVLEYGVDILLAPALNIQRNPLCGRNFEYYSEDPLVSGKIAAAYVRGVQSNGVGTSIKHFAANNQETNRKNNNVIVSMRALREIYLKGFEIAVKEAHPWTVMSSYNYINGTYASENRWLLTDVLRDEWGFDGAVITDFYGGSDVVAQMNAGNDMLEPGSNKQFRELNNAIGSNAVSADVINRNITRVLELIEKTPRFKGYKYSNNPDLKSHAKVARRAAAEGMVLLENHSTLPLRKDIKNVALYGCTSYDFIAGGTGSGDVHHAYVVSLADGLRNAGYSVDVILERQYNEYLKREKTRLDSIRQKSTDPMAAYLPVERPNELSLNTEDLDAEASANDVAILTIGRSSGEFADRSTKDFNVSLDELELIKNVCKAFHAKGKEVVIILNISGVIETQSWKHLPDAILCMWMGGQEGGNSVADVLSGDVCPSGKLTMTFPVRLEDCLSTVNFPVDVKPMIQLGPQEAKKTIEPNVGETHYDEDIYVGYRDFEKRNVRVSYPFGYGLSYTTFSYDNFTVMKTNHEIAISIDVTNKGLTAGKEIVQIYVKAPCEIITDKPVKELKAFGKTGLLQVGEKETLSFKIPVQDLASYDEASSSWVVDNGIYAFMAGASSSDIRQKKEIEIIN